MSCHREHTNRSFVTCLWLLGILFIPIQGFADDQIYKYTDESGTLNFTSEWYSIPEKYRNRVESLYPGTPHSNPPRSLKPSPTSATDMRTVQAVGEYRMGDHDTRYDAERQAVETAKRNALEQVATYLESVTVATNFDLTRDEIRSYTAGLVLIQNQQVTTRLEDNTVVIHVDLTARVDANEVLQAITALRENDDARVELAALRQENDQLQQQLGTVNQQIAAATDPQEAQLLAEERQGLLDQAQSNALVSQAWTDYVIAQRTIAPYPWFVVGQARSLLWQAWTLRPTNPHVVLIQKAIAPQVAFPPAPTSRPFHATNPRHHSPVQSPSWPALHPRPSSQMQAAGQVTLPPTIHQFHPTPPLPVPRQPFQLPSAHPGRARPHADGGHGHGDGGHHR